MQIETAGPSASSPSAIEESARFFPRRVPLMLGIAGLAAMILIPAAVVLYLGIATARQNTFQMLEGQAEQYLDSVVDRVSGNLKPVETQSSYVVEAISSGRADPSDGPGFAAFLRGALASLPQVHDLVFIYPDLHVVRVNRESGRISARDWTDDPKTRQIIDRAGTQAAPYWGEFFFVERTGRTMLNYRAPAWRGDKLAGVLVSSVALDDLAGYVTAAAKGPVRNAFILTQKGQVLAHSGPAETLGGSSDQHPLKTLPQISDQVLATLGSMGLTQWAETAGKATSRVVSVQSEPYMVITRHISGFGEQHWLAGLYFPMAIIDGQIGRINRMAITGSIILVLSVFGALLLGRGITRPVLQFVDATRLMHGKSTREATPIDESVFRELDDAGSTLNAVLHAWHRIKSLLPVRLADRFHRSDDAQGVIPDERDISVMFTDIAGFTSLAANLSPAEVASFLNEHFSLITDGVVSEGGTVDKYIGDSLMAFWGAPEDQPNHAELAFNAALEISSRLRRDNIRRREAGLEPVRVRIGVHSGKAIVGNIGAPGHLNYTAVGDTVNAAQRVEALGKSLADDGQDVVILVSRATIEQIGLGFESFSAGIHSLPGRYGALEVFRLS
jgi:adenylate cyclase